MGVQHGKRKKKKKKKGKGKEKKEQKENEPIYVNKIATLLYSTFERVPVVFYHANLY